MTHTKGPWKAGNDSDFWGQDCCIEADDPEVGRVVVCDFVHSSAIEEEANKALIKAAPNLLTDCEQVIAWLMIDPNFQDWPAAQSYLRQLQSTVAKAKGEDEAMRLAGAPMLPGMETQ